MDYTVQSIEDIDTELQTEVKAKFTGLSTSAAAEWKLWTYIFALAIRCMQYVVSKFVTEVNSTKAAKYFGTLDWYAAVGKEFQYGDSLVVDANGNVGYSVVDLTKRIIAQIAVSEYVEDGKTTVKIKVAKKGAQLEPLSTDELIAFKSYMERRKVYGTKLLITSTTPDTIQYHLKIFYSSLHGLISTDAIETALNGYRDSLKFNGVVYIQHIEEALKALDGVVAVDVWQLNGKKVDDVSAYDIMPYSYYETGAGYFNFTAYDDSTRPSGWQQQQAPN